MAANLSNLITLDIWKNICKLIVQGDNFLDIFSNKHSKFRQFIINSWSSVSSRSWWKGQNILRWTFTCLERRFTSILNLFYFGQIDAARNTIPGLLSSEDDMTWQCSVCSVPMRRETPTKLKTNIKGNFENKHVQF